MSAAFEIVKFVSEALLLTAVAVGIVVGFAFEEKVIEFEHKAWEKISDKLFNLLLPLLKVIRKKHIERVKKDEKESWNKRYRSQRIS